MYSDDAVINAPIGYYDTKGFKAKVAENGDIYIREKYYDERRKVISGRMVRKDLKDIPEEYRGILTEMYQDYLKATSAMQDQLVNVNKI